MNAADIDQATLGACLQKIVLASHQLGHRSLKDSIVYLHPDTPAAEFAADIVSGMATEHLIDKWFGGGASANRLLHAMHEEAQGV